MSTALKATLKQRMHDRDILEKEIAERSARLEAAGVGLHGGLVDREGFPRSDIDVAGLREDRQRVLVLSNDHKTVTAKLEGLLQQLHAEARLEKSSSSTTDMTASMALPSADTLTSESLKRPYAAVSQTSHQVSAMPAANAPASSKGRPFAVVDEVVAGSPAASAGVQLGDQWISFGRSDASKGSSMASVAATLQDCEGRLATAEFVRRGAAMQLQLMPSKWSGRGLLGCHLQALS
ncbi:hypothetical protein WJX74_010446 [Apatococcus lobatus]|uniref:Nas2 N-terminal domain-containing protein n=1 Tax=Apatococcus lobatus TaxID=904363 RepID=A0AAW1QMG4_9CHLO